MAKPNSRRPDVLTQRLVKVQAIVKDLERELPRGNGSGALLLIGGLKREIDAALGAASKRRT